MKTDDLLHYLSADNYKLGNSTVLETSLIDFLARIEGTTDFFHRALRLSNDISKWCETHSKKWAKKVSVSHWSDNARMVVFALIAIGIPTVVITYIAIYIFRWVS